MQLANNIIKLIRSHALALTINISLLLSINACSFSYNPASNNNIKTMHINYSISTPDLIITLPHELKETSGLSFNKSNNNIITLNDEKGYIYYIDIFNNDITVKSKKFYSKGDYEGIEKINNIIYCLNSKGQIFEFNLLTNKTNVYDTPFSSKNNTEGLCANKKEDGLLIACKEENLKKDKHTKAIYEYNLKTNKLDTKPIYQIKINTLIDFLEENYKKKHWKSLKKRVENFAPSGIAINPKTDNIYILSARGSSLVILTPQNKIENILFFNTDDLPQPEGICFDTETNLYISTEGKKGDGKICLFKNPD